MSDYSSTPPPPPPGGGGYQTPQGAQTGNLANWIQRVLAFIVDQLIILPFNILAFVFLPKTVTTTVNGVTNVSQSSGNAGLGYVLGLLALVVWGYNRWFLGGKGASLGKRVIGLTLISEDTGQPIGAGKAFGRDIVHILDGFCFIGYLFPLWDQKRQTFSDKILKTLVTAKA